MILKSILYKMITAIDLFSGAGGFSCGFEKAGANIVYGIEKNKIFAETHKKNFLKSKALVEDLGLYTPKEFCKATGLVKGDVSIIFGSPPCQTFSTIGVPKIKSIKGDKINSDERNFLFYKFFNYVKYLQPKAFILENVPQFEKKAGKLLDDVILDLTKNSEYVVKRQVLDAVDYGVPQRRKRLFIVGLKNQLNFKFPNPTHKESKSSIDNEYATVQDAIEDLPLIKDGAREHLLPYSQNTGLSDFQKNIRNRNGLVGNNVCRVSNARAKRIFKYMKMGSKYGDLPNKIQKILPFRRDIFLDRLKRLDLNKPSWTILAHIGMDGYMYIHPKYNRTLSVREAARIQSFPDSFEFVGNMREQYIQVGNSVPVLLAEKIAKSVISYFN